MREINFRQELEESGIFEGILSSAIIESLERDFLASDKSFASLIKFVAIAEELQNNQERERENQNNPESNFDNPEISNNESSSQDSDASELSEVSGDDGTDDSSDDEGNVIYASEFLSLPGMEFNEEEFSVVFGGKEGISSDLKPENYLPPIDLSEFQADNYNQKVSPTQQYQLSKIDLGDCLKSLETTKHKSQNRSIPVTSKDRFNYASNPNKFALDYLRKKIKNTSRIEGKKTCDILIDLSGSMQACYIDAFNLVNNFLLQCDKSAEINIWGFADKFVKFKIQRKLIHPSVFGAKELEPVGGGTNLLQCLSYVFELRKTSSVRKFFVLTDGQTSDKLKIKDSKKKQLFSDTRLIIFNDYGDSIASDYRKLGFQCYGYENTSKITMRDFT